jgi:hypothetical protein
MQNLTASIPHQLTRAEARRRIAEGVKALGEQKGGLLTDLNTSWIQDTMSFSLLAMGQSISGHLVVDDQCVHLTVVLPWLLSMFAGSIRQTLERSFRHALSDETGRDKG